ncbi:hypothetical protein IU443_16755 [Nocardia farcinica]|nr:hypothetical protein [Nocardia farcinica]MBF6261675.1 hypothetical protein [Nocardia farcinica]MBF6280214.1 hypothetical protein [Nocardia farcinica]MBF6305330.1 hypothetical protein [Nocardia farcinica]MBF6391601.1 hypothetical protein [Nocardia farcinica]
MGGMLEFAMLLMTVTVLVALLVAYRRGRGGAVPPAEPEHGSLRITGVSPRPEAMGEQFVTITGTLSGPSVPGTVVYGRFVWDGAYWPQIGDELPVIYPAGKPDRWQLVRPAGPA